MKTNMVGKVSGVCIDITIVNYQHIKTSTDINLPLREVYYRVYQFCC